MYMLSTEDSTHVTLMLMGVFQCLMYMLSTEDSNVTICDTAIY